MLNARTVRGAIVVFVACLALCCASPVFAVTYMPGPPPTYTIGHQTVALMPSSRERTIIGIGEQVECWISKWSDTDIMFDNDTQTNVQDAMGEVDWYVEGRGTVNPAVGSITTYTVPLSRTDDSASVCAVAHDSGTKWLDSGLVRQVSFNIRIPTGTSPYFNSDSPFGPVGPNFIGAMSDFKVQILPNSVNFDAVSFQENIPRQTFTFPDRTPYVRPAAVVPFTTGNNYINNSLQPNVSVDAVSTPIDPATRLNNGEKNVNCTFDVQVPHEFLSSSGWTPFTTETHSRVYTGATLKCHVGINGVNGGDEGPYQ
jgi:hypothetical protein